MPIGQSRLISTEYRLTRPRLFSGNWKCSYGCLEIAMIREISVSCKMGRCAFVAVRRSDPFCQKPNPHSTRSPWGRNRPIPVCPIGTGHSGWVGMEFAMRRNWNGPLNTATKNRERSLWHDINRDQKRKRHQENQGSGPEMIYIIAIHQAHESIDVAGCKPKSTAPGVVCQITTSSFLFSSKLCA